MSKKRVEANGGRIRDQVAGEIPRSDRRVGEKEMQIVVIGESQRQECQKVSQAGINHQHISHLITCIYNQQHTLY